MPEVGKVGTATRAHASGMGETQRLQRSYACARKPRLALSSFAKLTRMRSSICHPASLEHETSAVGQCFGWKADIRYPDCESASRAAVACLSVSRKFLSF